MTTIWIWQLLLHYNFTKMSSPICADNFINDSFVWLDVIITSSLLGGHLITERVAIKTLVRIVLWDPLLYCYMKYWNTKCYLDNTRCYNHNGYSSTAAFPLTLQFSCLSSHSHFTFVCGFVAWFKCKIQFIQINKAC